MCKLVLARRALEEIEKKETTAESSMAYSNASAAIAEAVERIPEVEHFKSQWMDLSRRSSREMIIAFLDASPLTVEELPEFLYLCILYAMVVLAQFLSSSTTQETDARLLLEKGLAHGQAYGCRTMKTFDNTVTLLEEFLGPQSEEAQDHRMTFENWDFPDLEAIFNGLLPE
jgi:hypothetical protein